MSTPIFVFYCKKMHFFRKKFGAYSKNTYFCKIKRKVYGKFST